MIIITNHNDDLMINTFSLAVRKEITMKISSSRSYKTRLKRSADANHAVKSCKIMLIDFSVDI